MKTCIQHTFFALLFLTLHASTVYAQNSRGLQYFRSPGKEGLNVFETSKSDTVGFEGMKVNIGADFALQFQSINHTTSSLDTLAKLGSNFNLPTANLNLNVQLEDGLRLSLITYLSSRHHPETWVKGGHIQIDKLDFIRKDLLAGFMRMATLRVGLDEINYGDAHFRRSDNARAIYNPFVGNYIMDAFTTEAFADLTLQKNGILVVAGVTNGKLNQSVVKEDLDIKPGAFGKIGYDRVFGNDTRIRLTGSFYSSPGYDNGQYLYSGDRTGARYYAVMQEKGASDNFRSGRYSPGFKKYNSFQINPFVKWKGIEFFGLVELIEGDKNKEITGGSFTQFGAEIIYRFLKNESLYFGGRYNMVSGKEDSNAKTKEINRFNLGGGWFLTKNVLIKAEYVQQNYTGDGWMGSIFEGGQFQGAVIEAVIGF